MPKKNITVLTTKDIKNLCFLASKDEYTKDPIISELRPCFTKKLRDHQFDFEFENGTKISYVFDRFGLSWKENDGEWNEEYAECLESARDGVFLVHHLRTHTNPYEAATLIIDTNTSLVTMIYDKLGKKSANRDVNRVVHFGRYGNNAAALHSMTDEVVGKVIDWKFADNIIIHTLYANIDCCAFISPAPSAAPGWEDYFPTFNPTRYVKIAEDLYAISFYAPHACGMEVTMLMDLKKMTALGAAFGFDSTDKFCSYTFGAKGAYAELGFIGLYTVR